MNTEVFQLIFGIILIILAVLFTRYLFRIDTIVDELKKISNATTYTAKKLDEMERNKEERHQQGRAGL